MQSDDVQPYSDVLTANVRAARARAGLTQEVLAGRMRQLGCKWHFQTVGSVERGQRPVQAYEVPALAMALGTDPAALLMPPPETEVVAFGSQAIPAQRIAFADDSVTWTQDNLIQVAAPSPWVRVRMDSWAAQRRRPAGGGQDAGEQQEDK